VTSQPRDAGATLCVRLPLRRSSANRLRAALSGHLVANGVPRKAAREVLLAADEAFNNAFMHSGDVGETELRAEVGHSQVVIEIRDRGCGFDPRRFDAGAIPDPLVSHGRGLFLIHRLMDEVEVRSSGAGAGTYVRMAKTFAAPPWAPGLRR
jgi:anti-sigma regulatory factor (Ser/Thr protein kinase)